MSRFDPRVIQVLTRTNGGKLTWASGQKWSNSKNSYSTPFCIQCHFDRTEGPYLSVVWSSCPNAAEKTQARLAGFNYRRRLLGQLLLATNHNLVPGEGIEDVGPVKVMLESGIELEFVAAVAEANGERVMLPVIKEKLKAPASGPPTALPVAESHALTQISPGKLPRARCRGAHSRK